MGQMRRMFYYYAVRLIPHESHPSNVKECSRNSFLLPHQLLGALADDVADIDITV
jgi:hypothetical protein